MQNKTKTKFNIIISTTIVFAILCMLNFLVSRHYVRYDLSKTKFYSLSEKTINVINKLDHELDVIVLFDSEQMLYDMIKRLLDEYKGKSKNIRVEYVDIARDIARTQTLAKEHKIERGNIVIFKYKDKVKIVDAKDAAEYDYSGVYSGRAPEFKAFKGESAFTSAILGVLSEKTLTVHFTVGHGEKSVESYKEDGIAKVCNLLKEDNLDIKEINLIALEKLPEDVEVLIIAGPTKAFVANELALLTTFVTERNGKLFCLLDPMHQTGLEAFLKLYGFEVGDNIVVDPERKLPFVNAANLFVTEYQSHPITAGFKNVTTIFPLVRSVQKLEISDGFEVVELIKTSDKGWGESTYKDPAFKFHEDVDLKGPVSIAAVGIKKIETGTSKIVVLGDSDFIRNNQFGNLGNADLFLNIVNWFVERKELIAISPKFPDRVNLMLSSMQMNLILWCFVIGIPVLWVVCGIFVRVKRR